MTTPHTPTLRPTWTCARFAAATGIHIDTAWRWCRTGTIAATKIGKCYYIPADEAERIIGGPRRRKAKS